MTALAGTPEKASPQHRNARISISGLTKVLVATTHWTGLDSMSHRAKSMVCSARTAPENRTLIKILSGYHAPDAGAVSIDGVPVSLPIAVGRHENLGLAFVHQNLGLFPGGTVLENLIAGDHGRLNPWHINWRREAERARELFRSFHLDLEPNMPVEQLPQVKRAQLAIVRAADRIQQHGTYAGPGLLVLDEPTPFLPMEDVRDLFAMMRRLAGSGVSIVFVSHDIDEIIEVTDRATVLRDGKTIGSFDTASKSRSEIVEMIVGRSLESDRSPADTLAAGSDARVRVSALSGSMVKDLSFDVRPGEILGLTGLIGSGYDEVPYLLSGASQAQNGRLAIDATEMDLVGLSPAASMKSGIVLIPADRQRTAVAPELSTLENISLPVLGTIGSAVMVDHVRLRDNARHLIERFGVKAQGTNQQANDLSGGNQQKVVLAKWLQLNPVFVLLDEPTQGIDVGARAEIYEILAQLCAAGACILCATSEFEQLEAIAHRVFVFDRGQVVAELAGSDVTKSNIAKACYSEVVSVHGQA